MEFFGWGVPYIHTQIYDFSLSLSPVTRMDVVERSMNQLQSLFEQNLTSFRAMQSPTPFRTTDAENPSHIDTSSHAVHFQTAGARETGKPSSKERKGEQNSNQKEDGRPRVYQRAISLGIGGGNQCDGGRGEVMGSRVERHCPREGQRQSVPTASPLSLEGGLADKSHRSVSVTTSGLA